LYGNREHAFQEFFEGHRVGADAMTMEKVAVTIPLPICEGYLVGIIGAVHGYFEDFNVESFTFLGVALGLLDLTDHSRVHSSSPLEDRERHAE
jgi:hypothetical protein